MDELIDGLELSPTRKFLTIYLCIDKDTKFLQAKFFTYLSKDWQRQTLSLGSFDACNQGRSHFLSHFLFKTNLEMPFTLTLGLRGYEILKEHSNILYKL